jgi:hypothetical protein
MNTPCKNAEAVQQLLSWTDSKDYTRVLESFWESWLISPDVDGTTADQRAFYLTTYKELREFLTSIDRV